MWKKTIYCVLGQGTIYGRLVGAGREYKSDTRVGYAEGRLPVAIGTDVDSIEQQESQVDLVVRDGFANERLLISDFGAAHQVVCLMLRKLLGKGPFLRPKAVVRVERQLAGGLSPVEMRTLVDLFETNGPARVYVWLGSDLTDRDISSKEFFTRGCDKGEFAYKPGDSLYRVVTTQYGGKHYARK